MRVHLLLLMMIGFSIKSIAQSKVETINVKTVINCDHCKRCASCGARLENAVFAEKGIKRVEIDEKTMTVKVIYNPAKTSIDKIRLAIAKVGYDADDVKADPVAYAKLDDCCKKQ